MPKNLEIQPGTNRIQEATIPFETASIETFNQYFDARTREIQASYPTLPYYDQMKLVAEVLPNALPYDRLVAALRLYKSEDPQLSSSGATALLYLNLGTFITVVDKFAGKVEGETDEIFQVAVAEGLSGLKERKSEKSIKQQLNRDASAGIQNYFQPSTDLPYQEDNPELVIGDDETFKPVFMADLRSSLIRGMRMKVQRGLVEEKVDNLPKSHRQVMYDLYGLRGTGEYSVTEAAKKYNVKPGRITQIHKLSLRRLRTPDVTRFIKDYHPKPLIQTTTLPEVVPPTPDKQEDKQVKEPVQPQQKDKDPLENLGQPLEEFQRQVAAERKLDELGVSILENEQAVREAKLQEKKEKSFRSRVNRLWVTVKKIFKG